MNRTQITILAGATAVGIVTAVMVTALATAATSPEPVPTTAPAEQVAVEPQSFDDLSPAEQTILTWSTLWNKKTPYEQDEFCAEAALISPETSAQIMAANARAEYPDTVLVEGVLADEIRLSCGL